MMIHLVEEVAVFPSFLSSLHERQIHLVLGSLKLCCSLMPGSFREIGYSFIQYKVLSPLGHLVNLK